jgi:hypothetical protein
VGLLMEAYKTLAINPEELFWADDIHNNNFTSSYIHCPMCKQDYVHFGIPEVIDGEDNYKARGNMVRGSVIRIPMSCESNHGWYLCFGFHKGATFSWLEIAEDAQEIKDIR